MFQPLKEINITERAIDAKTDTHTPAFCVCDGKGVLCWDSKVSVAKDFYSAQLFVVPSSKHSDAQSGTSSAAGPAGGSERRTLWIDCWPAESESRQEVSL